MNVRKGTKFDMPNVLEMIVHFQDQQHTPECLKEPLDMEYLNKLYHHIILGGGLALVAEHEGKIVGMMLGLKNPSVWFPNQIALKELMIWIEPEYRSMGVGHKLVTEFNHIAEDMRKDKEIVQYTMSVTEPFGKINYERFGYKKTEEVWSVGV